MEQENTFPVYNPNDLCAFLTDLKHPISVEQLGNPTPNLVRDVYLHFAELLVEVTWEQITQPHIRASEVLSFPELHQDSIPQIMFQHTIAKMLNAVGCSDFVQADLTRPTPARLLVHLSALVNFVRFREDVLARFNEFAEEHDNLMRAYQELQKQHRETAEKLAAIKDRRERSKPEVQELQKEVETLTSDLAKLNKQRATLLAENEALKAKMEARSDQLSNLKYRLFSTKEEVSDLKTKVVSSPEKLKQSIRGLAQSVATEKENISNEERRGLELAAKHQALQEAQKQLQRTFKLLEEVEAMVKQAQEVTNNIESQKSMIAQAHDSGRTLALTTQNLQRQVQNLQEKQERQERQHKAKMDKLQEDLKTATVELEYANADLGASRRKADMNQQIAKKIQSKIDKTIADHEQAKAKVEVAVRQLQTVLQDYHAQVRSIMQAAASQAPLLSTA